MLKTTGERPEPCGTPQDKFHSVDSATVVETLQTIRMNRLTPYFSWIIIEQSILTKALITSYNANWGDCPSPTENKDYPPGLLGQIVALWGYFRLGA